MVHVRLHATWIFMISASFYGCVRIFRKCFTLSLEENRSKRKRKHAAACILTFIQLIGLSIFRWNDLAWFVGLDCLMFHWRTPCHLHWTQCLFYIFLAFALFLHNNEMLHGRYKYSMKHIKRGEQNVGQTEEFNLPRWLLYEPEYNQDSTFSHFTFSFLSNLVRTNFERVYVCPSFSFFFF